MFDPTPAERVIVERLTGLGVPLDQIGRDWLDPPITVNTLKKHFSKEIETGRARTVVRLKVALIRRAMAGDMTALVYVLEKFFWQYLPPRPDGERRLCASALAGGDGDGEPYERVRIVFDDPPDAAD